MAIISRADSLVKTTFAFCQYSYALNYEDYHNYYRFRAHSHEQFFLLPNLARQRNQRTNGPVNAHLISWPSKAQNWHTKPGKYMVKK